MKEREINEKSGKKAAEVDIDDLENVAGAGNPFADVERVKVKEIDKELRDKI